MKFVDIFTKKIPYQRMKEVDTLPHYSATKKFASSLKNLKNIGILFKKPFIKNKTSNKDILLNNNHQNKAPIQNQTCHTDEIPSIESSENKMYSNEFLAKKAFELVRKRFKGGIKSANKIKPSDPKSIERQKNACNVVPDIQTKIYHDFSGILNYSEAWEKGAGNCGEMSGIAAQFINKSGGYATQYKVDNKGTHGFTLVGIPPRTAKDDIHFSDYDNCWVVDPWAGIVCEASQYTECFKNKMNEWTEKNKMILDHNANSWVEPNKNFLSAVVSANKTPIFSENFYIQTTVDNTWL